MGKHEGKKEGKKAGKEDANGSRNGETAPLVTHVGEAVGEDEIRGLISSRTEKEKAKALDKLKKTMKDAEKKAKKNISAL